MGAKRDWIWTATLCLYFEVFYDPSKNESYSLQSTSMIYEISFLVMNA